MSNNVKNISTSGSRVWRKRRALSIWNDRLPGTVQRSALSAGFWPNGGEAAPVSFGRYHISNGLHALQRDIQICIYIYICVIFISIYLSIYLPIYIYISIYIYMSNHWHGIFHPWQAKQWKHTINATYPSFTQSRVWREWKTWPPGNHHRNANTWQGAIATCGSDDRTWTFWNSEMWNQVHTYIYIYTYMYTHT